MHLVYKITLRKDSPPYHYIGCKGNCNFVDGIIKDSKNKEYWGSSKNKKFLADLNEFEKKVEILYIGDSYNDCLEKERQFHIENDVVANPNFYNLSIATVSSFHKPGYSTFIHESGKIARLPVDHPLVISGQWVGVTKGRKFPNKNVKVLRGPSNPFYGKNHSPDTILKIKNTKKHKWENDHEWREKTSKRISEQTRNRFKGKPKSEIQKQKMKDSNNMTNSVLVMNIHTNETKVISKESEEFLQYDRSVWVNPNAHKKLTGTLKLMQCSVCGIESVPGNIKRWHNEKCKLNQLEK